MSRLLATCLAFALVLPARVCYAQSLASAKQLGVVTFLSTDKIRAGETTRIAVQLTINEGWHVNSHRPTFDYLIRTDLTFNQNAGYLVADIQYPAGKTEKLAFADEPLDVYQGTVTVVASLRFSDLIAVGPDTIRGAVQVQACNDQVCLAPSAIPIVIPVEVVSASESVHANHPEIFSAAGTGEAKQSSGGGNELAAMFEERGSFVTFLAIFLIGLALNLTPCVYPMLSVTVSLFGTQTEARMLRVFLKAVVYVLGIATMYSVLGVTAALGGGLFGSWLQSPWVLGGIAVLLFGLALSSFGLYQIQMPYWLTSRLGGTTGTGVIGLYLSGLVVGVFAAPCVGPPVIALLTLVGTKGDPFFGFWSFFTLSLGLGFPYLILGTFSGLLKKIPRSGAWLVWVERIFGVILTGAALFYLALAVAPSYASYVIPLILIVGGIYLGFVDRSGKDKKVLQRIQWLFGVACVVVGVIFANGLRKPGISWESYSDEKLMAAKAQQTPVVMDFYADWCIPCLELDRSTFTDPSVVSATKNFRRLKVDLTHFDSADAEALRKKFGISGVPTVIFLNVGGEEVTSSRIIGYVTPEVFVEKVGGAGK
ncbi:MAG: cytochrome c biogenesis protein CcdA [Bacteroidota bacterium]